jgi:hypothetical protein
MMFRRLRSTPKAYLGFRALTFAVGLIYVLATTDTVEMLRLALDAVNALGEAIEAVTGSSNPPPINNAGTPK